MAIRYVDFEGAAGTGDGSTFANRARSIRALYNDDPDAGGNNSSSSEGIGPIAQDDEIRIKKSPDPTSLGAGQVWKKVGWGSYDNTFNSPSITYSTTKGETNFNKTKHGLKTGEWIKFFQNSNSDAYINGYWKVTRVDDDNFKLDEYKANSSVSSSGSGGNVWYCSGEIVELDNKIIEEVWGCSRPATAAAAATWTAVSGITAAVPQAESSWGSSWSTSNQWVNPACGADITIPTNHTTSGKAAYFELPSTLDLSSYQQISFQCYVNDQYRMSQTNERAYANSLSLRLCTDTAGATSVHTIPIECDKTGDGGNYLPVLKDFGANLNSAIKSIALYIDIPNSTVTGNSHTVRQRRVTISNIVASKASSSADSITHRDLVGLNTSAAPQWYPVWSIWNANNKTVIRLQTSSGETRGRTVPGYYVRYACPVYWPQSYEANQSSGNQSTTIYKRKQFWIQHYRHNTGQTQNRFIDLGGNNHPLRISGGWNTTDMSSKTTGDTTCIDGYHCRSGAWRLDNAGQTHSSGSGAGLHADGEDKTAHIEDLYLTRMMGYMECYRHSVSWYNLGFACFGAGNYFYFTHRIKKFGIICAYGFSDAVYGSYHGLRVSEHDENDDLFLTNSDGSHHSTYDKDTRFIKWCAGGQANQCVKLGGSSGTVRAHFSVINTEHHSRDNGLFIGLGTGSNKGDSNLKIDEVRVGYSSSHCSSPIYISGGNTGCRLEITNLYTTLGYRAGWIQSGNVTIGTLHDEDFGVRSNNQYWWANQGYWSYSDGFWLYSETAILNINGGTSKRTIRLYEGGQLFTDGLTIPNSGQTSSDVTLYKGTWEALNHDGTTGNNFKRYQYAYVYAESTIRKTASGYSLKVVPTSTSAGTDIPLANIIFNGGSQVTVNIWWYKNNSDVYGTFTLGGWTTNSEVTTNVTADIDAGNDPNQTWTQETMTFTPTGAGQCQLSFTGKGDGDASTDFICFDDMTITQA